MGSPFPGMDPYIEVSHLWEDFHTKLIGEIERALSSRVPDRYFVRTGERSYVALVQSDDVEFRRSFLPDVAVASRGDLGDPSREPTPTGGAMTVPSESSPVTMQAMIESEHRETFLQIFQADREHKLVTGIEIVSPSNKRAGTKGRRLYNRKRQMYLSGFAHFVEIDLLRRGRRMPMVGTWPDSPYYVLVSRKKQAPRCSVWPAYCTEPLPALRVPLAPPDLDVVLELQPLVAAIYERSRYDRDIDYRQTVDPPLSAAEAAWLAPQAP